MNLRDAMDQVEREQPHLTGTAKMQAIKALRSQPKPADPEPQDQEPQPAEAQGEKAAGKRATVREAWEFLVFVIVAMQVIPWIAWGAPTAGPRWFDVLHAALLVAAVCELISAYRRRSTRDS